MVPPGPRASDEQLGLVAIPPTRTARLGPNQWAVYDELERQGTLSADEAGAVVHEQRGRHRRDDRCQFCSVDGRPILEALRSRGLAHPGLEGDYAHGPPPAARGGPGELPDGY